MSKSPRLSRRTVLRGLGTAVALPLLDAMLPQTLAAAPSAVAPKFPTRMAFFFVPNGMHMPDWTPSSTDANFKLPRTLEPLEPYRKQLLVLTGLTHDKARANGDGPGDHARSAACFLTGCQPRKTDGANIRAGVSVDQVAAGRVGKFTRFPSLELGCDRGPQSGNCDSGYSCAYSGNISWKSESTPMAKEIDPRLVFERLFEAADRQESAEARAKRQKYNKSVLDFALEDAKRLERSLGATDRRKMDEYLTSVRELEAQIAKAEKGYKEIDPKLEKPSGVPKDYAAHIRLLGDLFVLAFQSDLTRVSTFMIANESSGRSYPFIQVPEGHHDLSHHGRNGDKQAKIQKINRFHMEQFAYIIGRLAAVKEGDGTLLDHSMIAYGSAISDGDRHNHDDLPVILLGGANGRIKSGRHLRYEKNTPLNNLWLSMLDRMDSGIDRLGDSTGRLDNLS